MAKRKPARNVTNNLAKKAGKSNDAPRPSVARQSKVKAKAKKARQKASSLTSRILGHVSARTRRKQAKRDATN